MTRRLVVLRHSLTRKGRSRTQSHLSPEGVLLAREVGSTLPEISYAVTGDQPRHLETAIALGVAVDEQVSWPSGYVAGVVDHHDQWSWKHPFVHYAELLHHPAVRAVVDDHLDHWHRVLSEVPEGGAGLVISSGGSIEPVLVAALPDANHASWGGALHQLEGAELTWDGAAFRGVHLLRR